MNPISIFRFAMLLSLCFHQISRAQSSDDLITQTCAKAKYIDLCEKTMRRDPESEGATANELTKIALKAAASYSKAIERKVATLLKTTSDESVKEALEDCSEIFESASEQLSDSLEALEAKSYGDVKVWIVAAMSDADSCEDGFASGISPLTQLNTNFDHLCFNVLMLTHQLSKIQKGLKV